MILYDSARNAKATIWTSDYNKSICWLAL